MESLSVGGGMRMPGTRSAPTDARGSIHAERLTAEERRPLDGLPDHDDDADHDDADAEHEHEPDAADARSAAVRGVHRVDEGRDEQHREDRTADEREQEREEEA